MARLHGMPIRRIDPLVLGCGLLFVVSIWFFLGFAPLEPGSVHPWAGLAIADLRGDAIVIMDPAHSRGMRRVALPAGPHELVQLPDGRLVATVQQAGALAIVDPTLGTLETLPVGGLPHGLALRQDVLYFTDEQSNQLRELVVDNPNPTRWSELPPIPMGQLPHMVSILPGGIPVVVNAGDSTAIIGTRVARVSAVPESLAISPDGTRIAVAGSMGDSVEVFDPSGNLLQTTLVGGRPIRLAFAPDGKTLAVSLSAAHAVALLLPGGLVHRVAVPTVPDGLAFDVSGQTLYAGDLYGGLVTAIDVKRERAVASVTVGESAGAIAILQPPKRH